MQIIQRVTFTLHNELPKLSPSLSSKVVKEFHKVILSLANHHSLGTYNAVLVILYCCALQNKQSHRNHCTVTLHVVLLINVALSNISKRKIVTRVKLKISCHRHYVQCWQASVSYFPYMYKYWVKSTYKKRVHGESYMVGNSP